MVVSTSLSKKISMFLIITSSGTSTSSQHTSQYIISPLQSGICSNDCCLITHTTLTNHNNIPHVSLFPSVFLVSPHTLSTVPATFFSIHSLPCINLTLSPNPIRSFSMKQSILLLRWKTPNIAKIDSEMFLLLIYRLTTVVSNIHHWCVLDFVSMILIEKHCSFQECLFTCKRSIQTIHEYLIPSKTWI